MAAQLGYCGLDRQRRPLRGDEIRGCWEAAPATLEVAPGGQPRGWPDVEYIDADRTPVRRLEFVEVRSTPAVTRTRSAAAASRTGSRAPATAALEAVSGNEDAGPVAVAQGEPRWSLWADAEP